MAPRLRTGDAAVPIVVVELEGIAGLSSPPDRGPESLFGLDGIAARPSWRSTAARQDALQHVAFTPIDGEGVLLAHLDHAAREPAAVQVREPRGSVLAALLRAIDRGAGQRQVQQVGG